MARFRGLHNKYKRDGLTPDEASSYVALRDELYGAVLRTQRLGLQPGQKTRQAVRVALVQKIQLAVADGRISTVTCDVGVGGFAAFVHIDPPVGSPCDFVLRAGGQSLRGHARVVGCVRHGSGAVTYRASFALESMGDDDRARLEVAVLDAALLELAM